MTSTLLELPRGEVGWQWLGSAFAFEVGASVGATLVGRWSDEVVARDLGATAAAGAYVVLIQRFVRADARWTRTPARDFDRIDATVCARAWGLSLCGETALAFVHASGANGNGANGDGARVRSSIGALVGFDVDLPGSALSRDR